jgi:hypothetical protein
MAIIGAKLKVGTVTHQTSKVPKGDVISQDPASGSFVAKGSPVNLVVSSGPETATVPNVVGLTQAEATTAITEAKLKVGPTQGTLRSGPIVSLHGGPKMTAVPLQTRPVLQMAVECLSLEADGVLPGQKCTNLYAGTGQPHPTGPVNSIRERPKNGNYWPPSEPPIGSNRSVPCVTPIMPRIIPWNALGDEFKS